MTDDMRINVYLMSVYDIDAFANDNCSKDGQKGKNGWQTRLAVHDGMRNVIHLQPTG